MQVSVLMSVYNGEATLRTAMDSILAQTFSDFEFIICDDGSTDETVHIIQRFIEDNSLQDTWRLYQNVQNRGYPGNFYYAMDLCGGEIVFLADQDDLWHRDKLEHMCQVFAKHPQASVVCCKLSLIDGEGARIHSVMAPTRETNKKRREPLRRIGIEDVFYKCEWPGMVMAYRREWYQRRQRYGSRIPHDFLICARAAEEGTFYQMDEILACHRRHGSNAGGEEHRLNRLLQRERKLKEIGDYLQILQAFAQEDVLRTETGKAALQRKTASMQGRYEALGSGRLTQVLRNAGRHWRETRFKTLVCDVFIVLKRRDR